MTRKLLILIITLVVSTVNGQTDTDDDFMDNDDIEKAPEAQETAEPSKGSPTNDDSTQEKSENPKIPEATESSIPAQEVTTQSNLRTTVINGQVYALLPAPPPFPNLGPSPFYPRPQPLHYPSQPIPHPYSPPMMPFMPMPYPMMFPPQMPPMIKPGDMPPTMKPGDAPNHPGSQVILLNQKNSGEGVVGQSTIYLKPDGNREIIIIK